jgi:hypothetical protein
MKINLNREQRMYHAFCTNQMAKAIDIMQSSESSKQQKAISRLLFAYTERLLLAFDISCSDLSEQEKIKKLSRL